MRTNQQDSTGNPAQSQSWLPLSSLINSSNTSSAQGSIRIESAVFFQTETGLSLDLSSPKIECPSQETPIRGQREHPPKTLATLLANRSFLEEIPWLYSQRWHDINFGLAGVSSKQLHFPSVAYFWSLPLLILNLLHVPWPMLSVMGSSPAAF